MVEADFPNEIEQTVETGFRFSRKSGDDGCPQGHTGKDLSRFFDPVRDPLSVCPSAHGLQDGIVDVLDRQIEITADLIRFGHGEQDVLRQMGRMGV